jgi:hypothetical protein
VKGVVIAQPEGRVYAIVTGPVITEEPLAIPVVDPIDAIEGLLLDQWPPAEPSIKAVVVDPAHTLEGPTIDTGAVATVSGTELLQPSDKVYLMVVTPLVTPLA